MEESVPGVYWPKDRRVATDDGAEIAYTFLGPSPDETRAPVVALCSGFLCPDTWWYHLAPALADAGYPVLLFHYRGIAQSTLPAVIDDAAFSVPRCAADLAAIVEVEQLDKLVLVGHSMGVQVMLEAYRQLSDRIVGVAALTGPYASAVRTLYNRREISVLVYEPAHLLFRLTYGPVLRAGWRAAWRRLPFLGIGRAVRAFGPQTSDEIVASYVAHAAEVHPKIAMRMAAGMHNHSAEDVLPTVSVPALVVVGGADPFSPPQLGEHMAEALPCATLRTAVTGTHGTILEHPELINGWVLEFLHDVEQERGASA